MNKKPDFRKISIFSNKQTNEESWKKAVERKDQPIDKQSFI